MITLLISGKEQNYRRYHMSQLRYRKHPRVYNKKQTENNDDTLTLSGAAAAGIIGLTFITGVFGGYFLKRRLG